MRDVPRTRSSSAVLEANNKSILARVKYLESLIQSPDEHKHNKTLLAALKSQGGLAKLSISEVSVFPMSLNTLKNRSDDLVPGGFAAIDRLRRHAAKAIQESILSKPASPFGTKQNLKDKVKAQEKIISQLWDEIALVTNVLRDSIALAQQFAEKCPDPADQSLFKKRRRELLSLLSLSKQPLTPSQKDLPDAKG